MQIDLSADDIAFLVGFIDENTTLTELDEPQVRALFERLKRYSYDADVYEGKRRPGNRPN